MSFEQFIARHFLPKDRNHFSGPLVEIATYSIALGVVVMILSISILRGFQNEISRKVVGFGSHIVVRSYELGNAYEEKPISIVRPEVQSLRGIPGVRHVQYYANKGGMIKTDDQIQGFVLKGVSKDYDTSFFAENLTDGRILNLADGSISNEVLISKTIADKLQVGCGDKLKTYFWQDDNYRARALSIVGIYNTDLTDFDEHFVIGDIRQVQKLNGWDSDMVAGYELLIDNFDKLDEVYENVLSAIDYDMTASTIVMDNLSLFSWLSLLDSNIVLILTIMAIVCIVSIISSLLIMIFEKTSTIGILKTLGASNASIRKIFIIKSSRIILKGVAIGNMVALVLCFAQFHFKVVKLDSSSYSMSTVPIDMNAGIYVWVTLFSIAVCMTALLIPTSHISKIEPAKSIKIE